MIIQLQVHITRMTNPFIRSLAYLIAQYCLQQDNTAFVPFTFHFEFTEIVKNLRLFGPP